MSGNKTGAELVAWAMDNLLASAGAIVRGNDQPFRIHTLVPARQANGSCKFLKADNRCGIHANAPFGCAFFDCRSRGDKESKLGLASVYQAWLDNAEYAQVWRALAEVGKVGPLPEICRELMNRHLDESERK